MLMQDIVDNKHNLTVEEQLIACTRPEVYTSIKLFLKALVADQFIKQKRALLPTLTAELPSISR